MNVKDAQKWLNEQFDGSAGWVHIDEDGVAGYNTMVGFVRALQILLRIDVDGGFGNGTKQAYNNLFGDGLSEINNADNNFTVKMVISLVNLALLCRIEVSNTDDISVFSEATRQGIISTMAQLGIDNYTGGLRAREIKALFTSDAYYLISNGDATTREIQQAINRKYSDMLDNYIATNGLYDRNMNTALIKMIQYEIGTDVDGGWGEGTMSSLPVLGPGSTRTNLVYILQYLLYLNGFDPNGFDGGFGNGVTTALKNFQSLMKLDVDGYCGRQAWSALVVSCGDTTRSANACDTRFEITRERARFLKENGYDIVGRYITGRSFKELRDNELKVIFEEGLKVFFIFQDNNRQLEDFGYAKGIQAASKATGGARKHNLPENAVIYFAVDMDVYEEDIETYIIPFFQAINDYIDKKYRVGIYGPREVCRRVEKAGLSVSSFVADMSSGYSCNIGRKIPDNWNYDQYKEIEDIYGDMDIDKVTYSGRIEPTSNLSVDDTSSTSNINKETYNFIKRIYDEIINIKGNIGVMGANLETLKYLAYLTYDSYAWDLLVGYDTSLIKKLKERLIEKGDERNLVIYSKDYNTYITLPHLAVSTLMLFKNQIGFPTVNGIIVDLCSWAGDLLTFAGSFEKALKDGKYKEEDCSIDKLTELIIDDNELSFGLEDLVQDFDAWVLFKLLNDRPINEVIEEYYNSDNTNRVNNFINRRMAYGAYPDTIVDSDSANTKLYKLAKFYLEQDSSFVNEIIMQIFQAINPPEFTMIEELADKIAHAFANKLTSL